MNYYYITNLNNADSYFIRCELDHNVCQADSWQDVIEKNNLYANGNGRLTRTDIAQLTDRALELYLTKRKTI